MRKGVAAKRQPRKAVMAAAAMDWGRKKKRKAKARGARDTERAKTGAHDEGAATHAAGA